MRSTRVQKRTAFILSTLSCVVLFAPALLHAAGPLGEAASMFTNVQTQVADGGNVVYLDTVVAGIIQAALALIGVIFLALMVYAGYLWMTARGESEQLERAKKTITAAVIGLAITLASYAISIYVVEKLTVAAGVN